MTDEELYREPWDVDVMLSFLGADGVSVAADVKMHAAAWMETVSGWQLGGLMGTTADVSEVRRVEVCYPDGVAEVLNLTCGAARHARTGDPRGTFTTLHIAGEPAWAGAKAQHEAMLQQMRDEGFSFIGDEEDD